MEDCKKDADPPYVIVVTGILPKKVSGLPLYYLV